MADFQLVDTSDGSSSIHSSRFNAAYHSLHGALQESRHVFIQHGLNEFRTSAKVDLLEVGFGSGLNSLLAWNWAEENMVDVNYTGIEAYPLQPEMLQCFNVGNAGTPNQLNQLHQSNWNVPVPMSLKFLLKKMNLNWLEMVPEPVYDLIFYDAFAPSCQPELWENEALEKCVHSLRPGGIWVTYCAKGEVRRTLSALGCEVERLPGPPFKRHMLRARKR